MLNMGEYYYRDYVADGLTCLGWDLYFLLSLRVRNLKNLSLILILGDHRNTAVLLRHALRSFARVWRRTPVALHRALLASWETPLRHTPPLLRLGVGTLPGRVQTLLLLVGQRQLMGHAVRRHETLLVIPLVHALRGSLHVALIGRLPKLLLRVHLWGYTIWQGPKLKVLRRARIPWVSLQQNWRKLRAHSNVLQEC